MLPGERESGVAGKLPEEGPLRPPVTFAERMQGLGEGPASSYASQRDDSGLRPRRLIEVVPQRMREEPVVILGLFLNGPAHGSQVIAET
jgi:hypothetical protein